LLLQKLAMSLGRGETHCGLPSLSDAVEVVSGLLVHVAQKQLGPRWSPTTAASDSACAL
jgi:hypothetical protein